MNNLIGWITEIIVWTERMKNEMNVFKECSTYKQFKGKSKIMKIILRIIMKKNKWKLLNSMFLFTIHIVEKL